MTLATHLFAPLDDRKVSASARKLLEGLPKSAVIEFVHAPDADVYAVKLPADVVAKGELAGLQVPGVERWMVLDRPSLYWMQPKVGKVGKAGAKGKKGPDFSAIEQGQLLLAETGRHRYTLLLPLIADDLRATLKGKGAKLTLAWEGREASAKPAGAELLIVAEGHEPYSLVRQAMAAARELLGTFRMAEEKHEVAPHGLGWCTWDAFYHEVDEKKLLEGLKSFRDKGVPLGWCILDDGWLQHRDERLTSFKPDPRKFPHGLAPVIEHAKGEGYVHSFGIWHTFQGYWCGIDPKGELGSRYRTVENSGNIRPWSPAETKKLSLVHPDDASRFFSDFHGFLRGQGVDFVKVDGQSATERFSEGKLPRVGTMRAMQHAAQASALLHFHGRMTHCMAHSSDVAFNLLGTSLLRNSDDYRPARAESHGLHVFENSLNSFWTHTFAVPDWDMFWSAHPEGSFHAAARALSGGPVYVSDQPGKQDAPLLWSLLDDCGQVMRVDRAGLPAIRSLFCDAIGGEDLLVLTNTTGESHLLAGVFHCGARDGKPLTTTVRPTDVPEYEDGPVVA